MPELAQFAADVESIRAGQQDVEDDRVVLGRRRHPERLLARSGDVGGVALLAQAAPYEPGHLRLVLDDQNPHA